MARRRLPALIRLLSGGEHDPIPCPCGGFGYDYTLSLFPMRHVAHCLACGVDQTCEPAPAVPQRARTPPEHTGRSTDTGWLPPD